ncbi:fructosamine kinase family protein [Halomonas sp. N3-2A]|uniref:fructosamine kinase family protein n=1 Tax=Halomonas sp. N3-2A TaxID=2014541 RepID=UPI002FC74C97
MPTVIAQQGEWLVMEALETIPHRHRDESALGEGLRKLHEMTGDERGWFRDNACGENTLA